MQDGTRTEFKSLVDGTVALVEDTAKLVEEVHAASVDGAHPEAVNLRKRIESLGRQEFIVVVVGDIKRGKSTLLNALLGREVFVKAIEEATATVGFLRHNDTAIANNHRDQAVVHFRDGRSPLVIAHTDLTDYTTRQSKTGEHVATSVEFVNVFSDSRFVKDGVTIVDTPGTNTVHADHLRITYDQVDRSHAALLVLNAGAAFTKTDLDFLRDMKSKIQRFFFVINKMDQIPAESRQRVINHVRDQVFQVLGRESGAEVAVYGICAVKALLGRFGYVHENEIVSADERSKLDDTGYRRQLLSDSNIEGLENDLEHYLFKGSQRTRDMLDGPLAQDIDVVVRTERHLGQQRDVLSGAFDFEDLDRKRVELERQSEEQHQEIERSSGDLVTKLRETLEKTRDEIREDLDLARRGIEEDLRQYTDYSSLQADWEGEVGLAAAGQRRLELARVQANRRLQNSIGVVLEAEDRRLRGKLRQDLGTEFKGMLQETPSFNVSFAHARLDDTTARELDDISARVRQLENELDSKAISPATTKEELASIEREREALRSEHAAKMQQMGARPEIERREESVEVARGPAGLLGGLRYLLLGKERSIVPKTIVDDSARLSYDNMILAVERDHKSTLAKINAAVQEKRAQLSEQQRAAMVQELEKKELERKIQKQDILKKEMESKRDQALNQAMLASKRSLLAGFDRGKSQLLTVVEQLVGQSELLARQAVETFARDVDEKLQQVQREMDELQTLRGKKEAEKQTREAELDRSIGQLHLVKTRASDLSEKLAAHFGARGVTS